MNFNFGEDFDETSFCVLGTNGHTRPRGDGIIHYLSDGDVGSVSSTWFYLHERQLALQRLWLFRLR